MWAEDFSGLGSCEHTMRKTIGIRKSPKILNLPLKNIFYYINIIVFVNNSSFPSIESKTALDNNTSFTYSIIKRSAICLI